MRRYDCRRSDCCGMEKCDDGDYIHFEDHEFEIKKLEDNQRARENIHITDMRQSMERRSQLIKAINKIVEKWNWWREDDYQNCITVVDNAIDEAKDIANGKPVEEGNG